MYRKEDNQKMNQPKLWQSPVNQNLLKSWTGKSETDSEDDN